MSEKYVKPGSPGAVVVRPATGQKLLEEGDWWPHDQFLMRRLRDGDVVEATPPVAEASPPTDEPAPAKTAKE
ncbi:DUF2635 domain-containing protein [Xanthobacter sp. DSM 24535]|uniref:DUF2635 domain-containing protein n=1 Tax=Roseixanthobacter psychrophilus TaxID=3119917 RepID=UPI00372AD852